MNMEVWCSNCRLDIRAAYSDLLFVSRHKIEDVVLLFNSEDAVPQHIETINDLSLCNDMISLIAFIILSVRNIKSKRLLVLARPM
jgi:hypothetical protein